MKKLFLLLTGTLGIVGAQAQYARNNSTLFTSPVKGSSFVAATNAPVKAHHPLAKTTSVSIIPTETFGTGTHTTLPTGWTAGGTFGKWHWTNSAPTGSFSASLGVMHSTSQANGWMIFDSDSIGAACSCAPSGWLQSPAYNCTGHTTVRLNFEDYFDKFNDSCYVWVSTSPTFATYTRYSVAVNNNLGDNATTANTAKIHINISAVAASQPAVYIRFQYNDNTGQTGGFAWMVDDVSLTELNANDVSLEKSFMFEGEPAGTCYSGSIFETPLEFVDSVAPVTQLSNMGINPESGVVSTAKIYQGTTSVYTQSSTYPALSAGATDSFVLFPNFLPTATGNYTVAFSAALSNDSDMTNNVDTARFTVSDTTWMEASGAITGGFYVHQGTPSSSFFQGARFDVPPGSVGDTVSGFGAAFSSSSVATGSGTVSIQLYSIKEGDTTGWTYVGSSVVKSLTTADYSTTSSTVWTDFRIDPVNSGGISSFILQHGTTYAAVIQVNNVTTDLVVLATGAPNVTGTNAGYFGQAASSGDNGSTTFGSGTIATGITDAVPLVRMYFGPIPPDHTGVQNLTLTNTIGAAYPNPANSAVNIPFTLAQDGTVKVTLTNMVGQVVKTQNIIATGGQSVKATFATGDLADGMYIYNVEANGQHSNGRIAITH